jgi:hypothetical protein
VPEYAAYLAEIGAAAAAVNAKHGTGTWQPVDLRLASDMALATAAYRRCDVLVVNAVADGMNLVAKEAVVVAERDMVLALSEATGAHDELGRFAVTLHPFDIAQQADALHEALTMPVSCGGSGASTPRWWWPATTCGAGSRAAAGSSPSCRGHSGPCADCGRLSLRLVRRGQKAIIPIRHKEPTNDRPRHRSADPRPPRPEPGDPQDHRHHPVGDRLVLNLVPMGGTRRRVY